MEASGGADTSDLGVGGWWRDASEGLHYFFERREPGTKAAVGTPFMEGGWDGGGAAHGLARVGRGLGGRVVSALSPGG